VSLEGSLSNVNIYCLVTVGVTNMITQNGAAVAVYSDNVNVYPDVIAIFKLASASGGSTTSTKSTTSMPTTMSTSTILSMSTTTSSMMSGTTGWTFLGCYADNVGGRTLMNGLQVPGGSGAMTIELCEATCKSAGYTLAGVEYSGECCKCPVFLPVSNQISDLQGVIIPSRMEAAPHRTELLNVQ
jgi:glucan 1,3-beta-glucosidase